MDHTGKTTFSKKWEKKFNLLQDLNADNLEYYDIQRSDGFKELNFKSRTLLFFNFPALFFNFFYYFYKGMYLKGLSIMALSFTWIAILTTTEFFTGLTLPGITYWGVPSFLCSILANIDYYRKVYHQEKMWRFLPTRFQNQRFIFGLLAISLLLWGAAISFIATHTYATNSGYNHPNPVKVRCGSNNMLAAPEELQLYGRDIICAQLSLPLTE